MKLKNSIRNKRKLLVTYSLLFSILMISLIISGCGSKTSGPVNIFTGTQGVSVELAQNNPPEEMYEDSETIVLAEIWNKGAYTPTKEDEPIILSVNVDEVYFKMKYSTSEDKILKGITDYLTLELAGKSEISPIGEKTIIPVAQLVVNKIPGTRESPITQIDVSACYPYKTYFAESICVDTDIYSLDKDPICKNKKLFTYAGQGAPIIVSKMEVDMIPVRLDGKDISMNVPIVNSTGQFEGIEQGVEKGQNLVIRPNFRIYFKNTDKGIILAAVDGKNPCITGPASRGESIIIKAQLGNTQLICAKPDIKMYSNEGSVRCWYNESTLIPYDLNRNYELPLKLEAEYFYKVTTSRDIKIIRTS